MLTSFDQARSQCEDSRIEKKRSQERSTAFRVCSRYISYIYISIILIYDIVAYILLNDLENLIQTFFVIPHEKRRERKKNYEK